ncbi:MAG: hypothetical protein AAF741_12330 [Bacteroidota bacterium]
MTPNEFKTYWTSLRVVHGGLMMGVLMFGLIVHFVIQPTQGDTELVQLFNYIVPGIFVAVVSVSILFLNGRVRRVRDFEEISDRLDAYRNLSILRWALIEFATLFALVTYLLAGDVNLLILGALGFGYLLLQRPDKNRMVAELDISNQEVREMEVFG